MVNRRQYNSTREPDGLGRSSTGYAADIGTSLKLPGFAAGEIYLGYLAQNYDARVAKPIAAVNFGGNVEWRPNAATALRINLGRSVEESAMLGSQGYLQTALRLGVEHEVVQRVMLLGSVSYSNADFAGGAGSSNLYGLSLGTRYVIAGNLSAGLEYDVGIRASSAALPSYTRQVVELRLRGSCEWRRSLRARNGRCRGDPRGDPRAVIDNRVFVLVLQHPQERRETLATAAATVAALRRARLVAGLSWPNLSRVLGRRADPKRWGVLYLGSARPAALGQGRETPGARSS